MRLYFYIYFVSHNNIESRFEIEKERLWNWDY